jgi:SAM-dependent methyltransferase
MWVGDTVRDHAWLLRRLPIRSTDLVLDVGSGASPNLRANVLCDKFVADATERGGQPLRLDRPFFIADAQQLPFADKAFDFVICSHLLEHVEDPAAVLEELQRVAPRGYIETPNANYEKLQGFPFHRWLVWEQGGVLHLARKHSRVWDSDLHEWFVAMLDGMGIQRRMWFRRRRVGIYTSFLWEGLVPYTIDDRGDPRESFAAARLDPGDSFQEVSVRKGLTDRMLEPFGRRLRRRSDRARSEIDRLLACPDCRGPLGRSTAGAYTCTGCLASFSVDAQNRPCLLPSAERTLPEGAPA